MKKILSILITVTMLFSLVGAFRAPTAKAAAYGLTKATSWMPTTIISGGQYVSYKLVNYTMGENIVSTGDGTGLATRQALLVSGTDYPDDPGFYDVVQTTVTDTLGHFSLATSNVRYDGLYKVIIVNNPGPHAGIWFPGDHYINPATTPGNVNVLWGAYVFIKYVWQLDKPASITYNCQSTTFSGYLRFGSGKGADTGLAYVYVNYPNFTIGNWSSVQIDGNWAMSVVINQKGYYLIWVLDGYAGVFTLTGEAFTGLNSVTGLYDSLIGGLDLLAYDSRTTGGAKILIDTLVKPTLLYVVTGTQEIVIKAVDDTGDPVVGATWTVTGFDITPPPAGAGIYEIAPGVYKFVGAQAGSIASFTAKKVIGAISITSNLVSVPFTPLSKFNPVVTVDVDNANAPWYYFGNAANYTYDLLPCKIGYSFLLKTGVYEVSNTGKYSIQYHKTQVKGPVFGIPDTDLSEKYTNAIFAHGATPAPYTYRRYLVTGTGEVSVIISQKTWEIVDSTATFDEYNACCLSDSMTFTIGKDECCDVKIENPEIKVGAKGDLKIDISGEACGCDVIVRVSPANPAEDFFTLSDGTEVGELWYNLTGALTNYNSTCDTFTHHIYPWPYTNTYIDQNFQMTNGSATYVGGVVKWPNVTANYCDWLKVEVFTKETTTACSGTCSTYKFCAVLPYSIHVINDIVTITADKDTLVAGLPETVTFKGLTLKSTTSLWVYYSDLIPWYQYVFGYWTDVAYTFVNNGDGTATINFLPPPSYYGVASYDDSWIGADLTVEFRTPDPSGNGCTIRQIAHLHIVPPTAEATITTGCGEKIAFDGLLTEGFSETFCLESLKDPRNDASILDKVTALDFDSYYDTYSGNCYIPGAWEDDATCAGCGTLCRAVLGLKNPNSNDDPNIYPYVTINGVYVYLPGMKMVVTPPTITVDPNKDIPFITLGEPETMLKFSAIDAHGKPMCGKTFSIYDINTMATAYTLVGIQHVGEGAIHCEHEPVIIPNSVSPEPLGGLDNGYGVYYAALTSVNQYHTGTTGSDGNVIYPFRPPFGGRYAVVIVPDAGATIGAPKLPLQAFLRSMQLYIETKYMPPVKDTEAPAIAIDAPADGAEVSAAMVTVSGKVTDNVGVVSLWIGAIKVDFAPDGTFSKSVDLVEGANTIKVFAFDAAGLKSEKVLAVKYTKPVEPTKIVVKIQIGSDIMTVNGKAVQIDAPAEIMNGRTFLPLRAISEALGATVDWIVETQGITVTLGDNTIGLQVGNTSAVVNGTVMTLDAAPYIKNNRTMVPFRVIAEGLGATVEWDPALRIVTVTLVQ
jgi:hypothetical protein